MSCLLLASKRFIAAASHPHVASLDCSRIQLRWKTIDPTTVALKRLPKIELNPGEKLPLENTQKLHIRVYKTLIVNTDGSSYYAENPMPYPITFLPLDLSKLSEEELEKRRMAHLPPKKVNTELDEGFSDEEMEVKKDYEHLV